MTPNEYQKITETFLRLCELTPEVRGVALEKLKEQDESLFNAVAAMLECLSTQASCRFTKWILKNCTVRFIRCGL